MSRAVMRFFLCVLWTVFFCSFSIFDYILGLGVGVFCSALGAVGLVQGRTYFAWSARLDQTLVAAGFVCMASLLVVQR